MEYYFNNKLDFAQLVKVYRASSDQEQRYSPGEVAECIPIPICGNPIRIAGMRISLDKCHNPKRLWAIFSLLPIVLHALLFIVGLSQVVDVPIADLGQSDERNQKLKKTVGIQPCTYCNCYDPQAGRCVRQKGLRAFAE